MGHIGLSREGRIVLPGLVGVEICLHLQDYLVPDTYGPIVAVLFAMNGKLAEMRRHVLRKKV